MTIRGVVVQSAVELEPVVEPEHTLWCAVLLQAVRDARLRAVNDRDQLARDIARNWLTCPSHDLHNVLLLVGIDAGWWHQQAVPALREAWTAWDQRPRRRQPAARQPTASTLSATLGA